jgi:hypothetical protein
MALRSFLSISCVKIRISEESRCPQACEAHSRKAVYSSSIENGSWKFQLIINCRDSCHVAYTPHGPGKPGIRGPMSPAIRLMAMMTRVIGQTRVRVNTRISDRIFMSRVWLHFDSDSDSFRDRDKCEQTCVKG